MPASHPPVQRAVAAKSRVPRALGAGSIALIALSAIRTLRSLLQIFGEWADAFPGFESEMQGVTTGSDSDGRSHRGVYCLTES